MANAKLTLHVPHIPPSTSSADADKAQPAIFGLPLKYVSLVTLAVQNALLTIIMHYSRVSTPPDKAYSAASAVLLNELLKCGISLLIALTRLDNTASSPSKSSPSPFSIPTLVSRSRKLSAEVFSPDCWKLSIPAILYVIQNNLQFVAAANLDVATFQVTYQMKILTTAGFSVLMLRKKLSPSKWLALVFLALGVGIVQIQAIGNKSSGGGDHAEGLHQMYPLIGFLAVTAACFTSGLAGVYFEKVLKTSQADLWVRNVQLSLFSLIPALVPVFFASSPSEPDPAATTFLASIFKNFGFWAWATVLIQVFGGLVTAVVIKYSDNILKGFATSLAIVLSSVSSVFLFGFAITPGFMIGASVVLGSTWLYNQPDKKPARRVTEAAERRAGSSYPGSPVEEDAPIIGLTAPRRTSSSTALFQSLGLASSSSSLSLAPEKDKMGISATSAFASLKGSRESFSLGGGNNSATSTPWGGNTPHRGPSPAPGAGPNGTTAAVIPLVPLTVNVNGGASVNGGAGYFSVDPTTRRGDGSPPGRMQSHGGTGSGNGSPTGYGSGL